MKFALLTLAEAANQGPLGRLNALGLGARIIQLEKPDELVAMSIVGAVDMPVAQAGEFDFKVWFTSPDSKTENVVEERVEVGRSNIHDDRLPTGLAFVINAVRGFAQDGIYVLHASLGETSAEYPFAVRGTAVEETVPTAPKAPTKVRAGAKPLRKTKQR